MDRLWMSSCQVASRVKVGVVWVVAIAASQPLDGTKWEDTAVVTDHEADQSVTMSAWKERPVYAPGS